ncbi:MULTISPECIES: NADH-quinone oxidoreductase subunit A [Roseobacteraceae]|uniref:NADH-quinone oxidoreductase subunit n=3 Tax=Roseobacteraceae TaxID=2854170 RepID=A0A2R8BQW6_9RHOB|nr:MULTISPECIES: NADH-quinone oxidoreductase subunit A [Roseobacteraceae]MDT0684083.1 NADH-quinone oxidoreductase subunit A [Roseicyclus sp. F158]SEO10329.1 NADH dehydrogenase subunit A [Palleronia pelagia]SPJ22549.1 NAD(P)H-quinone oxidoreductase subunit 3 [Palleronia abyssalis]
MQTVIVILGWTALAVLLARAMQPVADSTAPQAMPFLGGGTPDTHAWQRYHFRPYSMALLFVAFEMEMMFMYPWAVVFVSEGIKALAEMGMFLAILSVGILYGWREGIFRWQ